MRSIALAIALALTTAFGSAAFAQTEPRANQSSDNELWGTEDHGEDKGRVQATGSTYNVTHIAYAAVLISITGVLLILLIRRQTAKEEGEGESTDDD